MSGRRWSIWLGPPVALLAVALVMSRFQPGVEAGGRTTPPPAGTCAGAAPMGTPVKGGGGHGTWWRLEDRLDGNGTLVGRTLFAGRAKSTTLTLGLGAESMARGPVGGLLVVASDDGRFSEIRLVSAVDGCSWLVHRTEAVVRSALINPSNSTILAHLLQRETREDRGTWRITGVGSEATPELVLGGLPPRPDLGPIWVTELRLDTKGRTLAVQSCAELACLTRVVSLAGSGPGPFVVEGANQGSIVGLAGGRLITWAHCPGMPCAVQAWKLGVAGHETLVEGAVGAGLTADGRYLVAVLDPTGRAQRFDLSTGASARIRGIVAVELPLDGAIGAYAGLEVAPGELAMAAPGGDAHAFDPAGAALEP